MKRMFQVSVNATMLPNCRENQKRKRNSLPIIEKVRLLEKLESGVSVKNLMAEFGVGTTTIYDLKKKKDRLLKFYSESDERNLMEHRKTLHRPKNAYHDRLLMEWVRQRRKAQKPLNGMIITRQAKIYHKELNIKTNCSYSEGWLHKFKKRHGIRFLRRSAYKAAQRDQTLFKISCTMETSIERKRRLARERKRRQRARETQAQKLCRREADARYRMKKLSCESFEESEARRLKSRLRQAQRLANETVDEAEKRRSYMRLKRAERIANESIEEAERRRADLRRRLTERIANETEEEARARRTNTCFRTSQLLGNEYLEKVDFPEFHNSLAIGMKKAVHVYFQTESLSPNFSNGPETSSRLNPTSEILSSANSFIQNDSPSHPTAAKLQKKTDRQFGNQFFEERQQGSLGKPILIGEPHVQLPSQRQVPQHMQVTHPPPAPPAPRQVQALAPPVQVPVAKPKPVEKPRPREKRLFVVADHQRCVMSNLSSLWKSGKLCDAGIGNGTSMVLVHKVVLSAVCPKLLSVFSTDVLSQKFLQVNFPDEVSTEALNAFAEYMYNGILDLDHEILEQLKIIAKRLDMKEFMQLCDSHLPNLIHQPSAAAASFTNFPSIQTNMSVPAMSSSTDLLGSHVSISTECNPSITTRVIDVKQEITEADLAQVQKDTAAIFGQESAVAPLAPNKSGNSAGFVICPSIKTEPVETDNNRYGQSRNNRNNNQVFTSTTSPSSSTATYTSVSSVPSSSTEFSIPFSQSTDVKSTRLKTTHSYETPLVADLSPVSHIVETMCSQPSPMTVDSSKSIKWPPAYSSCTEGSSTSTSSESIYPVGLFTSAGESLPILTTETVDVKTIDLY